MGAATACSSATTRRPERGRGMALSAGCEMNEDEVMISAATNASRSTACRDARLGGRRKLGALPPPPAGEGWRRGQMRHEPSCVPPPCPSSAKSGVPSAASHIDGRTRQPDSRRKWERGRPSRCPGNHAASPPGCARCYARGEPERQLRRCPRMAPHRDHRADPADERGGARRAVRDRARAPARRRRAAAPADSTAAPPPPRRRAAMPMSATRSA